MEGNYDFFNIFKLGFILKNIHNVLTVLTMHFTLQFVLVGKSIYIKINNY